MKCTHATDFSFPKSKPLWTKIVLSTEFTAEPPLHYIIGVKVQTEVLRLQLAYTEFRHFCPNFDSDSREMTENERVEDIQRSSSWHCTLKCNSTEKIQLQISHIIIIVAVQVTSVLWFSALGLLSKPEADTGVFHYHYYSLNCPTIVSLVAIVRITSCMTLVVNIWHIWIFCLLTCLKMYTIFTIYL